MYQRKVQITGGSTFFVTLPKAWAEGVGIDQGNVITLVPNDSGALLLIPEHLEERNSCTLTLDDWEANRFRRKVISSYIAGYDVIEITGKRIHPEQRQTIREVAQALVGLEILEETNKTLTLHCVVKVKDLPVERTLDRIFAITCAMLNDAVHAFSTQDNDLARDVIDRDSDVDRLVLLVARQFSLLLRDLMLEKEMNLSRLRFLYYHTVADQLERVADHAVKISETTLNLKDGLKKEILKQLNSLSQSSQEVIKQAVLAFKEQDSKMANAVLEERGKGEEVLEWVNKTTVAIQPEEVHSVSIVTDSLLRIREYGFNIAENALDSS